jgi:hypothetical protein
MAPAPRNARAEAQALLVDGYHARVLEPSPPASTDPDWYAHDEAAVGDSVAGEVVTPTSAGGVTWDELAQTDAGVATFARERWLGNWRRLAPVPDDLADARADLNRLAFYVLSSARRAVNGKIGLRWTLGGFGTPFYGADVQLRLEGLDVVRQERTGVRAAPLTTLSSAAALAGVELEPEAKGHFDVPEMGDDHRALAVRADHVAFLSDWFGFATSALEELRLDARADETTGRVQLWPEHFDVAVEVGSADEGRRASYGASPGDAAHPQPYLYVAPWSEPDRAAEYWNDAAFGGASVAHAELLVAADQRATALDFYRRGLELLTGG